MTRMRPALAIRLSLGVAAGVFLVKLLAWWVTGSAALFSDALESVVNIVAAGTAAWAIRIASQPPDRRHPYGHAKAEQLSAAFEAVLILIAAGFIVWDAWRRLGRPEPLESMGLGLTLSAAAAIINIWLGLRLLRAGKANGSDALVADAKHVLADAATSIMVIAGLLSAQATGYWILDPLLALGVAIHVSWIGIGLLRGAASVLMDESLPGAELLVLKQALDAELASSGFPSDEVEVHDLRTRRAGRRTCIEFHLVVPGEATVEAAHRLCDSMEASVHRLQPEAHVTIHVEPDWKAHRSRPPT